MKKTKRINANKKSVLTLLMELKSSWAVFFPQHREERMVNHKSLKVAELFGMLVRKILSELDKDPDPKYPRLYFLKDDLCDSVSCLNEIFLESGRENPLGLLLDAIIRRLYEILKPFESENDAEIRNFYFCHAGRIVLGFHDLIQEYLLLLETQVVKDKTLPSRLPPFFRSKLKIPESLAGSYESSTEKINLLFKCYEEQQDTFKTERIFRYKDGAFTPTLIGPIRRISDFYGYASARELFRNYFEKFSFHGESLPLLISSLPGLGKTHFTISHTLHFQNLSLVLCRPGDLEKPIEKIISDLSAEKNKKFVLFFDDVDTRKIDWYYFRTNIGGTFVLPANIAVVIASNYEFPANISSRGRCFTFPIFDEITCQEMIYDFILSLGVKSPKRELVSVIAADYVEEFGQHIFEELSPRTLVRYLERYKNDEEKRRKTLNMSKEQVIAVPDSASFYEANQKVMERLNKSV